MAEDTSGILWQPMDKLPVVDKTWGSLNKREPSAEMDKNAFLQLLITQMKYQDPLNPMDDRDFLGQMAQFSALEQMQNLNATYAKTQAYSMIGKTVTGTYQNPVTGEYTDVEGFVDAVTTKGSEVFLYVDGYDIPLSSVTVVGDDHLTSMQLDSIYESVQNQRVQSYVGKHIQALLMDAEGNVTEYVEGKVDYVKFNGNQSILVVGNKEVFPGEVASVTDKAMDSPGYPFLLGKAVQYVPTGLSTIDSQIPGTIVGVNIVGGKAQLQINNGGGVASIPIDKINYAMETLAMVGTAIDKGAYQGTVTGITIMNGSPYINLDSGQSLSYAQYKEL